MITPLPTGSTELAAFPEKGNPRESRLTSIGAAWSLCETTKRGDEKSSRNRQVVNAMIDGEPPYSPDAMLQTGNAYRFNINFLEGDAAVSAALTRYTDLIDSVPCLANVELPFDSGDPIARDEAEEIIDEEFHDMVRGWGEFDYNWEELAREFCTHGVSFLFFPNDDDWKWQSAGLDKFHVPRQARASEEKIDLLTADVPYLPHELYAKIKDEAAAKAMGWDVDQVKKQLVRATKGDNKYGKTWTDDWAELQMRLKNNDLEVGAADAVYIQTKHMWVREFDGKVSHFILPCNPKSGDDFLCKRVGLYEKATNAFVMFTSGTGNGTLHSVRGLGWRIFPMVQTSNRLRCGVLDGTNMGMALLLQPTDEATMDAPPLTINGPVAFLSPEMRLVERGALPNVATQAIPVINDLSRIMQNNTGSYQPRSGNPTGQEMSAAEYKGQMEIDSALTVSEVNKFYRSWDRALQEQFRRVQQIKPTDKRFPEVVEFYKNCEERGVPPELVKKVRRVKSVRAIGLGSPQQRQLAFGEMLSIMGSFDEVGRAKFLRDMISNRMDRNAADRYKPRGTEKRPVIDEKIAQLENADFREGQTLEPGMGENHAVHAMIHIGAMLDSVGIMQQIREAGGDLDFDAIQKELQFLEIAIPHTGPHVAEMAMDPTRKEEAAQMRQALQNIDGIFQGFLRQLQRAMQIQQSQEQEAAQAAGQEQDPALVERHQKHMLELQIMQERHREKMLQRAEDVNQKLQLRKLQFDERMAEEIKARTVARLGEGGPRA